MEGDNNGAWLVLRWDASGGAKSSLLSRPFACDLFTTTMGGANAIRADDFSDDARAGGNVHFDHNHPNESLDRVGADRHARRDLFAGEALHQKLHGLLFPRGQAETAGEFSHRSHPI